MIIPLEPILTRARIDCHKWEYDELIEKRIEELEQPEYLKSVSTCCFVKWEERLCSLISKLKKRIGIDDSVGVGCVCYECREVFASPTSRNNYTKGRGNMFVSDFNSCLEHEGRTPVEFMPLLF